MTEHSLVIPNTVSLILWPGVDNRTDVEGILEGARLNDMRSMHKWRNVCGDPRTRIAFKFPPR